MIFEPSHPTSVARLARRTTRRTKGGGGGWIPEHRWIVEQAIGRYLRADEAIHHINGIKHDNRLENLQIMDVKEHATLSARDYKASVDERLRRLEEYERRYGPLVERTLTPSLQSLLNRPGGFSDDDFIQSLVRIRAEERAKIPRRES